MSALLELRDIAVAYGDRIGVRDATLIARRGEAVGLAGPSGSGKSTLLAAALGLLPPGARIVEGSARFGGEDLLAAGTARLRELRGAAIGYVPQDAARSLNPTMRAGAQVAEAMTVHGSSESQAADRARELLAVVGLTADHARAYPHELSGGQRQRVAVAAAIANEPALLVADEPTTGLDVVVAQRLLDLLADLRERMRLTLVLISHDERAIARLCDRVVRIAGGAVRDHAPRLDLAREEPTRPLSVAPGPVLELRRVSVAYRRRSGRDRTVPALRDVDLEVQRGEIVGLIGRSGAGKTTLALAALGLLRPSSGVVLVGGQPLHALGRRKLRRARTATHLIFQDPYDSLPERRSVDRIVSEPHVIRGSGPLGADRLCEALERAGLAPASEFTGRAAGELSGGERQRLALARAIAARPRLIVADEPTSMLDADLRIELIDRMRALRDHDGTSFVFISHDLALARRFCDRLVVLQEGRIVESGPAQELLAAPRAAETRTLLDAAGAT